MFSRELLESCIASSEYTLKAKELGVKNKYEEDGNQVTCYTYNGGILITDIQVKPESD